MFLAKRTSLTDDVLECRRQRALSKQQAHTFCGVTRTARTRAALTSRLDNANVCFVVGYDYRFHKSIPPQARFQLQLQIVPSAQRKKRTRRRFEQEFFEESDCYFCILKYFLLY
ncbi:unnamed protein product [Ixodes pacificus]